MKEISLVSLLLVITLSAASGCRSAGPAQSGGDSLVANATQSSKNSPQSQLPAPKGLVNDFASVLDEETKVRLETTLAEFKKRAKIDFAVVTVKTTGGQPVSDYSLAVARDWAVGSDNPDKAGLLMLVAVDDRKWHIQLSRALEQILSNEEVARLGTILETPFREEKYGEGITRCADALMKTLSERRGLS